MLYDLPGFGPSYGVNLLISLERAITTCRTDALKEKPPINSLQRISEL